MMLRYSIDPFLACGELDKLYSPALHTIYSTPASVEEAVHEADLVIGSVLIPGKTAPKLITRDMIRKMHPGTVIVDVAIDQSGCCDTSRRLLILTLHISTIPSSIIVFQICRRPAQKRQPKD